MTPRSLLVIGVWRLKYIGQTRLGGSFVIRVLQFYSLVDRFRLKGSQKGFSPSSSISSSITHLGVILWLHLSSLTLVLYFYCFLFMCMHQSRSMIALYLLLFRTQISQSKSNLAVILFYFFGSKQALVFQHKSELSQWLDFQNSHPKKRYMKSLESFSPYQLEEKLCSIQHS